MQEADASNLPPAVTSAKIALPGIFAVLACLVFLRFVSARNFEILDGDDTCSLVAAAGKQEQFNDTIVYKRPPYNTWATAADWKQFMQPDHPFCFRQIGQGLARTDIHPPLYFWLLHVTVLVAGVHLWTGLLLNAVIDLITALCLYRLSDHVLQDRRLAVATVFLWAVSPAVIATFQATRQYSLLALFSVLLTDCFVGFVGRSQPPSRPQLVKLSLLTAAGLLTQFHFVLPLSAGCLYAVYRGIRKDRSFLLRVAGAVVVGCILAAVLHPEFYRAFANVRSQIQMRGTDFAITTRLAWTGRALISFFVIGVRHSQLKFVLAGVVAFIGIIAALEFASRSTIAARRPFYQRLMLVGMFCAWELSAQILMYCCHLSPFHAMGPRYLAMTWPLLACLIVGFLRWEGKVRPVIFFVLAAGLAFTGAKQASWFKGNEGLAPGSRLKPTDHILVDNSRCGILLPWILQCPDKTHVFVAKADDLIAQLPQLCREIPRPTLYLSRIGYETTDKVQARILAYLQKQFSVSKTDEPSATVYRLSTLHGP